MLTSKYPPRSNLHTWDKEIRKFLYLQITPYLSQPLLQGHYKASESGYFVYISNSELGIVVLYAREDMFN